MLWPYARGGVGRGAARIDAWLPRGARKLERHELHVPRDPAAALDALSGIRLRDVPVVGALFRLRGIPFRGEMSIREFFGTSPFVILEEEPGREVVFGVVGPFWELRRGRLPTHVPRNAEEFRRAVEDGRMAAVGNLRAEPAGEGSRLWTETWGSTPGAVPATAFAIYWLLIGPFSAWIRRLLLRAARERALAAGA